MSRQKGSANLAASLEVQAEAPLDARTVVALKSDLTNALNFPYAYVGMPVFVKEESKLYTLTAADVTTLSNWKEVGGGGSTVDGVVEYVDTVPIQPDDVFYRLEKAPPSINSMQIEIPTGLQDMEITEIAGLIKNTVETSSDGALSYDRFNYDQTSDIMTFTFAVTSGRSLYAENEHGIVPRALPNGAIAHVSSLSIEVCRSGHYINLKLIGMCVEAGNDFGSAVSVPLHEENGVPITSNASDMHEVTAYTENSGLLLSLPLRFFESDMASETHDYYRTLILNAVDEMNSNTPQLVSMLQYDGDYDISPETDVGIYFSITNNGDMLKGVALMVVSSSVVKLDDAVRVLLSCNYGDSLVRQYNLKYYDAKGDEMLTLEYQFMANKVTSEHIYFNAPFDIDVDENSVWLGKSGSGLTKLATEDDISELQSNFQAGVDGVYNALNAKGLTPSSKSLSDVVSKINSMQTVATVLGNASGTKSHTFANVKNGDYIIFLPYQYSRSCVPSIIPNTLTKVRDFVYSSYTMGVLYKANADISSLSLATQYSAFSMHIKIGS